MNTDERVELLKECREQEVGGGFEKDFVPMGRTPSLFDAVEMLLKKPGTVAHEIVKGEGCRISVLLLVVLVGCLLGYGVIMGFFSGGMQLLAVPVKTVGGILLSALLCFPSFYIFTSLQGGKQSVRQAAGLLIMTITLMSVLMVGFAPVSWLFSQSTHAVFFMGLLHIVFFMGSAHLSLQLLNRAMRFLNQRTVSTVKLWGYIFMLVVFQMCTVLRPMVDKYESSDAAERTWGLPDKKLFIANWGAALEEL
jgi:hypothetical protein